MKKECFIGLTGKLVTPEDAEYSMSRQVWNHAIQKFPLAVIYCYNKFDVSNAVRWARCHSVPFRIRSGGHNYEGYSTGNDVLVIDISLMKNCVMSGNQVTIGGGVNNRQLYNFISQKDCPFPGGTCPTVGLSGLVTGGGWGLSCRMFGLGCDSLVQFELIDYNGNIWTANEHCNSDLFWACRGAGGGNFGVIVSMTFLVPPKVKQVTFIEFYYPDTDQSKQSSFLCAWQNWLAQADKRVTLISNLYHSIEDGFAVYTRGIFYGSKEEAACIIKPLTGLGGCQINLESLIFYKAITKIQDAYPTSEMFKSAGRFVVNSLDSCEADNTVGLIRDIPQGSALNGLTLYALGGRVAEKESCDTAFYYRNAQYMIALQSVWEEKRYQKINTEWVDKQFQYLEQVTAGSYVNFPYAGLCNYQEAYYGTNIIRLLLIKKRYDPMNVFHYPQSIG